MVETVRWGGVNYRRYPESAFDSDRTYFRAGPGDVEKGRGYLHRDVWTYHNGPIPPGYHVHHIDGDPSNDDISNLAAVSPAEHSREHPFTAERLVAQRAHLDRIRPSAAAWHQSEEGRAYHRAHPVGFVALGQPRADYLCDHCGTAFTAQKQPGNHFCSNKCKSAWRRKSGLDDVEKVCPGCGNTFRTNRYKASSTCSRKCAWVAPRRPRGSLQHHG